MASPGYKASFVELKERFSEIKYDDLCGMSFGTANNKAAVDPLWKEIHSFLDICIQGSDSITVPDGPVSETLSSFQQVFRYCEDQSKRTTISEFDRHRENSLRLANDNLRSVREKLYFFAIGAVHNAGLLNPAQIINELEQKASSSKKEIESVLERVKKSKDDVDAFAKTIVRKARDTAREISFTAAQNQFSAEKRSLLKQLRIWGGISLLLVVGVIVLIAWFYLTVPETVTDWHPVIIRGVIRLFSLSAASGLLAYTLGVFRAYLHMYRLNQHRMRVANCIGAFTEAGEKPETRDLVLINLVETVCAFGNSGLLTNNPDSIGSQKASVESFSRALTAAAQHGK